MVVSMLGRTVVVSSMLAAALVATADTRVTVGRLGQTIDNVRITSKSNGSGRVYYTCKPYEYLVLTGTVEGAYQVLLQNGARGWIASKKVATLPYDVTRPVATTTSRGSYNRSATLSLSQQDRAAAAEYGTRFAGTPYKWGGNDPINGIDCSAFVKYLYGKIGVNLPRTAAEQALVGKPITRLEELQKGDRLYFWSSSRGKIGHTGMYLGQGYFVHSSSNHNGVATDYLSQKWLNMLVAARR